VIRKLKRELIRNVHIELGATCISCYLFSYLVDNGKCWNLCLYCQFMLTFYLFSEQVFRIETSTQPVCYQYLVGVSVGCTAWLTDGCCRLLTCSVVSSLDRCTHISLVVSCQLDAVKFTVSAEWIQLSTRQPAPTQHQPTNLLIIPFTFKLHQQLIMLTVFKQRPRLYHTNK